MPEYRLEDMYKDKDLEKLPAEQVKACYPRAKESLLNRRRWLAHTIIQQALNIIVERCLEQDVFQEKNISILVEEIRKDPKRMVKPEKKRQLFTHTRGRRYALVLHTGKPHRYYLRLKGWLRYELFNNIKNKAYEYNRL
jgi:hypothetical protein